MQPRSFAVAVFLLLIFAPGKNPGVSATMQSTDRDQQAAREHEFLVRRENFTSGRELLLSRRVPFDPDELVRDGWTEKLKPTLDAMPEMHETRYEKAPLKGAYLADTLYLPEKVQLTGHTVILANYVVFEGKKPVIKGNFDLHFFPTKPVVVLDTTLAAALHKKAQFLNVKFGGKVVLPSFSLLQDLGQTGKHEITFDVSGLPPEAAQHPLQKTRPILLNTSWSGIGVRLLLQQQEPPPPKTCQKDCGNSGGVGATGSEGNSPGPGLNGNPDGGPPAANGSCLPGQSDNGSPGTEGGAAPIAQDAGPGGVGGVGQDAGNINVDIVNGDTNQYTFIANGGQGGKGGPGGTGGAGGNGGAGTVGGNGVACSNCTGGNGGNGGKGGDAARGGRGGDGGTGGPGGNGGTIMGTYSSTGPMPAASAARGTPGGPGDAGMGGQPGNPGQGGKPGQPATSCGITGSPGSFLGGGNSANGGNPGNAGNFGQTSGQPGTINLTPKPKITAGGGGGGPAPNPCLNGATASPGSGAFTNPGPGTNPTCSPIIVDTHGEGFPLTSAETGVKFDITGTGQPVQLGWTERGSHNAFLALPGSDGLVHNGKELFGNFTAQPESEHPNGFLALAQFDRPENGGNGDGVIDDDDAVFSRLRLWIDGNHDGICQAHELHTLPELGVFSLALKYAESRRTDDFGNQFRYRARVNPDPSDGESDVGRWTYDVFLATTNK